MKLRRKKKNPRNILLSLIESVRHIELIDMQSNTHVQCASWLVDNDSDNVKTSRKPARLVFLSCICLFVFAFFPSSRSHQTKIDMKCLVFCNHGASKVAFYTNSPLTTPSVRLKFSVMELYYAKWPDYKNGLSPWFNCILC